ncbi:MAG: protease modulator HflC [Christensenellales bacterium]
MIDVTNRAAMKENIRAIKNLLIVSGIIIIIIILFSLCTFTVGEAEQATVYRFGVVDRVILNPEISFTEDNADLLNADTSKIGNHVNVQYQKGLCFIIPFVETVKKHDSWLNTYVSQKETINTKDKKQYMVTMYAQWRISNPALFDVTHQTKDRANQYLDNMIYPILIQSVNRLEADTFLSDKEELNKSLTAALESMNKSVRDGGIEVVDIQVNSTLLPPANLQSTYDRMTANRQKVAQQLRSEGEETYQKSVAEADLEASILMADAVTKSKEIKGQADAEALEIYANSYKVDPDFYGYWRSLKALVASVTHDATIVLDRNHPLWTDLLDMIGAGKVTAK